MAVSKVALIKSQSMYGALPFFIEEIAQAFEDRGIEAAVLDLRTFYLKELGERLRALGPLDLVFSFNVGGDYRDPDGRTISQATGAPHVVQFVDHPLHHIVRLRQTPRDTAILVVDRSHARAIKKLFGPHHFAHVEFSPHGALGSPAPLPATADAFAAERPITALFSGTCYRREKPKWEEFPAEVRAVFAAAAEAALSREWLPALDAVDGVLEAAGMDPNGAGQTDAVKQELRGLREAAFLIHDWVRSQRRLYLLDMAARSGLALTVIGTGYDNDVLRYKNVNYEGAVEFPEMLRLMRRTRLVLNANANFGEGSHERPLTAMVAGAAAATDASTFYTEEFEDGRDIALFRWTDFARGMKRINELARDPEALFEMAKAGRETALARHRWSHRIDNILAAAQAVKERPAFKIAS